MICPFSSHGNFSHRFLGQFATKSTPIQCLHFTRKNLLLAVGPYSGNSV